MIALFYAAAIAVAIGVILMAYGFNLQLPHYDRNKLLSGISFKDQWQLRYQIGKVLIAVGAGIAVVFAVIIFGPVGLVETTRYEYYPPKSISVVQEEANTIVIAAGVMHNVDKSLYYWIDNTYPGVCLSNEYNIYGMKIQTGSFIIIDILPEEDERFLDMELDDE